jgi:hypothetical protein
MSPSEGQSIATCLCLKPLAMYSARSRRDRRTKSFPVVPKTFGFVPSLSLCLCAHGEEGQAHQVFPGPIEDYMLALADCGQEGLVVAEVGDTAAGGGRVRW